MSDQGWTCPKCRRVYAPYVPNCFECNTEAATQERAKMVSAWSRVELRAMTAAMEERTKIVAWLRLQDRLATIDLERILADEIEAGEHLK